MLVVINIDSLMRGALCGKLHGGRSQLLFALQQLSIDSQLFVENHDLCLPHLHSTPRLRGSPSQFGMQKPEWFGYPTVKKIIRIRLLVLTEFTNVTDRRTDRRTPHEAIGRAYA